MSLPPKTNGLILAGDSHGCILLLEAELLSAAQTATISEKVQLQLEKVVGLATWEYEGVKSFAFTNNGLHRLLWYSTQSLRS